MKEKRMVTIHVGDGSPIITTKPYRNVPCRCGSGKKQKNCCGDVTSFYSSKKVKEENEKPLVKTDGEGVEHAVEDSQ